MDCPEGLYFDHISKSCGSQHEAGCFKCPEKIMFTDVPVVNECQQFVRCYNQHPEQLTCADGLYFDTKTITCNFKNATVCEFKVVCPINHSTPIFTRHPSNCAR